MNLNQGTIEFIQRHLHDDVMKLRLRYASKSMEGVDIPMAITQIEARQRVSAKVPEIARLPGFIFPNTLSAEQCTAHQVALYHAHVASAPDSVLDLTCGLGIDLSCIGAHACRVEGVDMSPSHVMCASTNMPLLGVPQARVHCAEASEYLHSLADDDMFDLIFVDPARRGEHNKRTYALQDCSPDVVQLLPLIRRHAKRLIVKVSPMLDVASLRDAFAYAMDIHAVSLKGECKELLLDIDFTSTRQGTVYHAVNITGSGRRQVFSYSDEQSHATEPLPVLSDPSQIQEGMWIFEPNASLMKFIHRAPLQHSWPQLVKVADNTHLYLGTGPVPADMPGRVCTIEQVLSPNKKSAGAVPALINIVTRNFPMTPSQVAKMLKVREGGDEFLYCCRVGRHQARMLYCSAKL